MAHLCPARPACSHCRLTIALVSSLSVSPRCLPPLPGGFSPRASPGLGAAAKREQWAGGGGGGSHNGASAGSQESTTGQFLAVPGPGQEAMVASGPERRKMGGSYSRYTGGGKSPVAGGMVLVTDGELCDSSGRVIKTTVTPVSPPVAKKGGCQYDEDGDPWWSLEVSVGLWSYMAVPGDT